MNVSNPNLQHQENIRIILKNEDFIKRQKVKKRDKKSRKDKSSRKEIREKISQKSSKEHPPQKKEVFASGDNIVISVCFNNNNNNNSTGSNNNNNNVISKDSNNDHTKLKSDIVSEDKLSTITKSKSKKRQASPAGSIGSNESFDKTTERRQRKHKHNKKVKSRRERGERNQSKEPHTPPMNPPSNAAKRKNDAKPIAIIDLEKSPGKEVTQSPKEVIILSDSEGENKKRDVGNKEIVIIEDTILEKGISNRNHSSPLREHHTPPESPPLPATQPGLKFSIKTKSNILPFNLLHDQAEEVDDLQNVNNTNVNTNEQQNIINKQQQEVIINTNEEKNTNNNNNNNLNEAYDPFEPTKSGSTSPVTPPQPNDGHSNDINNKNSNKLEGLNDKIQLIGNKDSSQIPGLEEHQANQQQPTGSLWNRNKEFDKKSSQPLTPPMPPTFAFSSSNTSINKPHLPSLYDGIYGSDLKTPVVPSPIKSNIKPSQIDKSNDDDDDMTPYSPSSDGYGGSNNDYEPPPQQQSSIHQSKNSFDTIKHSDTQSSDPSASYSYGNDDTPSKTTPLKLTASTLKSFNSMRTGSLQYVNKAELSIFENYLPASQQKSPLVKRQPNSSFLRTKMSRFTSSMNENGSPHRNISFTDSLKPPVIGKLILYFSYYVHIIIYFNDFYYR